MTKPSPKDDYSPKFFDDKDFVYVQDNNHDVKYHLYFDKNAEVDIPKADIEFAVTEAHVCFSALHKFLRDKKGEINRILYLMQYGKTRHKLELGEKYEWLRIAKHNKVIPSYVTKKMVASDKYVIDISNISPSLCYVYLTSIRVMQEHIGFTRTMLTLVNKYKTDFFGAWVIASKFCFCNAWHNIVEIGSPYGGQGININNAVGSLSLMVGLKRYMKNPKRYDARDMYNWTRFNASDTIAGISHVVSKVRAPQLLHPYMAEVLRTKTDDGTNRRFNRIDK